LRLSGCATLAKLSVPTGVGAVLVKSNSDDGRSSVDPDLITLFLCGDVMTGRAIDQVLPHPGSPRICELYTTSAKAYINLAEEANGPIPKPVDFAYLWGDALAELARRSPDLRIINLETSITKSEDCTDRGISYRMSPENVPCLTAAGFDCCVLANNHVLDWGRAGLVETLETLEGAEIKSAGAGRDILEAAAPAVLEIPGKSRVLVLSFGMATSGIPRDWAAAEGRPGVNFLRDLSEATVERIGAQLRAVRQPQDIVIASIHWGANWGYYIPQAQHDFSHRLIERAGVNVVYGHSSHHAKGIEVYKNRPILYGCGDFLNDYEGISGYEQFRDDLVLMYFLSLAPSTGMLVGCRMIPLQIRNFRLNRTSGQDARWLRDVLNREGEALGTSVELGKDNALALRWR
jgi:poly-gamma-glutamate synthesis protein (capsule biosynthesis protein)